MSIFTQGSELYYVSTKVPGTPTVVKVACPTGFSPGGAPADQLEDTCLDSDTKTFKQGLRTPGAAAVQLLVDPTEPSHLELYNMTQGQAAQTDVQWALGWSDGKGIPPTVAAGEFVFPTTRTWYTFEGYVADFPFDFATNTLVGSAMSIQRSGAAAWIPKVIV